MYMNRTIAYLRVSTDKQDLKNQRLEILEYARKHNLVINEFLEIEISSRKDTKQRRIDELLGKLNKGDTLIVSELSRLGRSVGQVITIVDTLIKQEVRFIAIKENMTINGKHDIQSKVMITLFGLFAEIERDLISERTKQGLIAARAKGRILGRPQGSLSNSKLTGQDAVIQEELKYGVAKSAIARKLGVSRNTLVNYIHSRQLSVIA